MKKEPEDVELSDELAAKLKALGFTSLWDVAENTGKLMDAKLLAEDVLELNEAFKKMDIPVLLVPVRFPVSVPLPDDMAHLLIRTLQEINGASAAIANLLAVMSPESLSKAPPEETEEEKKFREEQGG